MRVQTMHLRSVCSNGPIKPNNAVDQRSDIYRRTRRFLNQGNAAAVQSVLGPMTPHDSGQSRESSFIDKNSILTATGNGTWQNCSRANLKFLGL